MILKGNQRGGAKDLALHLMKEENEHVEVHELRGFASESLMGALNEAYALSRGTRCKQFLYSLSLNPPPQEKVGAADFEAAIERVEEELGLSGQPRAIIFHEKEGRRHAHAVWSRIETRSMKAVQMSFDHKKLVDVSRELFLEHGWKMPRGLVNRHERDPKNFTLEEWQQAKRTRQDPRAIKMAFAEAWAISDSKAAFIHALKERGYTAARGDRRGFVALDVHGEVYSIPRYAGVKTKAVRQRLDDESALPSVTQAKAQIAGDMLHALERFKHELNTQAQEHSAEFRRRCKALVQRQRAERQILREKQEKRGAEASQTRQARFRSGIKGLWDRLRGEHKRVQEQNEREAQEAFAKDRAEKDGLTFRHLEQRRQIDIFRLRARQQHAKNMRILERDKRRFSAMVYGPDH